MTKQALAHRRRRGGRIARRLRKSGPDAAVPPREGALRGRPGPGALLDRILDSPHLARVVPRLPPEVLHQIIQHCGLEDCGGLVTLAAPEQLARVFDLDLWRSVQPGRDEQFDADRFGVWLEVLLESGADAAARTVAQMDAGLMIGALAQHLSVFDEAAASAFISMDGHESTSVRIPDDAAGCEVGGYRVLIRRPEYRDGVVALLMALALEYPDRLHLLMRGCRGLSNSGWESDGLDDLLSGRDQIMCDLAIHREQRRERLGYVTPADARAFLEMSRHLSLEDDTIPPGSVIARAYARAIDSVAGPGEGARDARSATEPPPPDDDSAPAVAAVIAMLVDAAIVPRQPVALLEGAVDDVAPRLALIQAHMRVTLRRDPAAHVLRLQELAYLGNTMVAGCSIQDRAFTAPEASDAAAAICNLGLENWPHSWLSWEARHSSSSAPTVLPEDFLVGQDLVRVFQVGWTVGSVPSSGGN